MLTIERRNEIKTLLFEKQSVTVSSLAGIYHVSFETIRRDFDALEKEGFLTRTHGGAVLRKRVKREVEYRVLSNLFSENKQRIAAEASGFITNGDCIFIDHSTTAYRLIHELNNKKLTVMTNSIKVLSDLSDYQNSILVSTGGILNKDLYCFLGSTAEKTVRNFHMDKAFLSCRAIDMHQGLSDNFEQEADMRKTIIENADSVYLLMDHTKFDKVTFVKTCSYHHIKAIITDQALSEAWKESFESKGIEYYEVLD